MVKHERGFPATARMKRQCDFQRAFQRKRSVSNEWLILYGCENELPLTRLGLSVSRKFGCSPKRNRIRRLYREAFRLVRSQLPVGLDIILIPRKRGEFPELAELKAWLISLTHQVTRKLSKHPRRDRSD